MPQVSIIGAGSWGSALAKVIGEQHDHVTLWTRGKARAKTIQETRINTTYLPGHILPPSVFVTSDLATATKADWIILSLPSQHLRETWARVIAHASGSKNILNTSKGLEAPEGTRLSQIFESDHNEMKPHRFAVLSGPNHAEEVADNQPTTTVIASEDVQLAETWQNILMSPMFRVYTSDDMIGVELGGALKNIIALAAGMADGLGFGDNTKAALITRGLAEISRLGMSLGAQALTFSGLSGVGDLIATCTSPHSRNARAGRQIGKGVSPRNVIKDFHPMIIEGIPTCQAAVSLAHRHGVDMPITQAVYRVLFENERPMDAVRDLMTRGPKSELHALYP